MRSNKKLLEVRGVSRLRRVWQETQSLKVLLMDEELTSIVVLPQGGEAESWGDGLIKDAGPDVLVVTSKGMPPEAEYLQAVQWK